MTVIDHPDRSEGGEPWPLDRSDLMELLRKHRQLSHRLVDDPPLDQEWEDWAARRLGAARRPLA